MDEFINESGFKFRECLVNKTLVANAKVENAKGARKQSISPKAGDKGVKKL